MEFIPRTLLLTVIPCQNKRSKAVHLTTELLLCHGLTLPIACVAHLGGHYPSLHSWWDRPMPSSLEARTQVLIR